jgi:hypothetical protein
MMSSPSIAWRISFRACHGTPRRDRWLVSVPVQNPESFYTHAAFGSRVECRGETYLLHLAHACIPGRRECAIKPNGAGEPPMPEIGSRPAEKPGGGGNGIDARKRPCRSGPRALAAAGSSAPKGGGREALPAGRAGVAECGQGSAKGPRRPAKSVCCHMQAKSRGICGA